MSGPKTTAEQIERAVTTAKTLQNTIQEQGNRIKHLQTDVTEWRLVYDEAEEHITQLEAENERLNSIIIKLSGVPKDDPKYGDVDYAIDVIGARLRGGSSI